MGAMLLATVMLAPQGFVIGMVQLARGFLAPRRREAAAALAEEGRA